MYKNKEADYVFPKHIGIDIGYGYVKASDGQQEVIFPSTVGVGTDLKFNSLLMNLKNLWTTSS